jgi:hypothetical protein
MSKPSGRLGVQNRNPGKRGRPPLRETEAYRVEDERASSKHEAEEIFGLVERGVESLESARALIGVPERIRAILAACGGFKRDMRFRGRVSILFERLVLKAKDKQVRREQAPTS